MKKRIIALLCCASVLVSTFTACNSDKKPSGGNATNVDGVKFWSAYNTQNFMQNDEPLDTTADLVMNGIKGETESVQLMVTPENNISNFNVEVTDLLHEDNQSKIAGDKIGVFVERYIETKKASYPNSVTAPMYPGFYPDALIPIDKIIKRREDKITGGDNQGFWFNVDIPADAKPGNYKATVKVTLNDKVQEVPMTLKVYDLLMPEEVHAKSAYEIWYHFIQYGEGVDNMNENTFENYYWFLANKRITPTGVPTDKYTTPEQYAEYIVKFAQSPKITVYNLPYVGITTEEGKTVDKNYLVRVLTALINKNIELRKKGDTTTDLLKKGMWYLGSIIDEPDLAGTESQVAVCDRAITQAKLEVKHLLKDYPDLQKSLIDIPHMVVTVKFNEKLAGSDKDGGIQTWNFQIDNFGMGNIREVMKKRRANPLNRMNGEDFWWYNCVGPANPYPTFQLDDNLISSRVMSWMQYDFKVSGQLYYCINFYRGYKNGAFYERDIWNDPETWEGVNGDGWLVYPGSRYGMDTPISTLRLESIRESKEDYEYLWLFEREIEKLNKSQNKTYSSDEILTKFYSRLYTSVVPKTDSASFAKVRVELLDLLDTLTNNSSEAVKKIDALLK